MTQNEQPTLEIASPVNKSTLQENDYVAFYLDENGNKVWLTQEQRDRLKLYPEELKQQKERQECERIAKEKAEEEWWESRKDWIERFPFEPTHHPEITFDPYETDRRMRDMVQNHGFLRYFYENKLRYTEEFEQM